MDRTCIAGLLSSFACTSGNTRLTLVKQQQPSTVFQLQPVQPAAKNIGATTLVRLVVRKHGGQQACLVVGMAPVCTLVDCLQAV